MNNSKAIRIIFIFVYLVIPREAYAYIDPGEGSIIVEIIIAFIVSGVFFIKLYWRKIISLFKRRKNGKNKN